MKLPATSKKKPIQLVPVSSIFISYDSDSDSHEPFFHGTLPVLLSDILSDSDRFFCSTFSNPFFQELILPSIIRQTAATYQMMAFKIIQQDHVIAFLHSRDFNLIKFQLELLLLLRLTVLYHIIPMSIHTIKQLISIANILLSQQQVNLLDIQLILLRPRKMNPAWILTSATGHLMVSILHHGPTHFQPKLTNLKNCI